MKISVTEPLKSKDHPVPNNDKDSNVTEIINEVAVEAEAEIEEHYRGLWEVIRLDEMRRHQL